MSRGGLTPKYEESGSEIDTDELDQCFDEIWAQIERTNINEKTYKDLKKTIAKFNLSNFSKKDSSKMDEAPCVEKRVFVNQKNVSTQEQREKALEFINNYKVENDKIFEKNEELGKIQKKIIEVIFLKVRKGTEFKTIYDMVLKLNKDQIKVFEALVEYLTARDDNKKVRDEFQYAYFHLLVLGPAGTGKSFCIKLMRLIIECIGETCIIATHQNLAARNIDGVTIHSLFGFNNERRIATTYQGNMCIKMSLHSCENRNCVHSKDYVVEKTIPVVSPPPNKTFNEDYKKTWLIIDEISMLSIDCLNDISSALNKTYANTHSFGGVNMILLGDFKQLPPVKGVPLYKTPYDFHKLKDFKQVYLEIPQRQGNDSVYYELCMNVRVGKTTDRDLKLLKSRLITKESYTKYEEELCHIFPLKLQCQEHNLKQLHKLKQQKYVIEAVDTSLKHREMNSEVEGVPVFNTLAVGSKIMFTSTVKYGDEKIFNGTFGVIKEIIIDKDAEPRKNPRRCNEYAREQLNIIDPLFINANQCIIKVMTSSCIDYYLRAELKEIQEFDNECKKEVTVFTRIGFPLILASGVTVHRVQGLTMENIVVDLSNKNFQPELIYVALTRVGYLSNLNIIEMNYPFKRDYTKDHFIERFLRPKEQ